MKLINAKWIWTEPHSRVIKIEITVQAEILQGTVIEKTFMAEFKIINLQCEDCAKVYTPHIWTASA